MTRYVGIDPSIMLDEYAEIEGEEDDPHKYLTSSCRVFLQ